MRIIKITNLFQWNLYFELYIRKLDNTLLKKL
jgi:hypothetical protein